MSNKQTQDYNEYMYELEKANDERENRLAGEEAKHEGDEEKEEYNKPEDFNEPEEYNAPEEGFDNEETKMTIGNPMIDREPQDELDRVSNRESYSFFENNCQYEND